MIHSIIFDWKRTLYDPDEDTMIDGAVELLKYLKSKKIRLILVGKGGKEMHESVVKFKVTDYFSDIVFQEGKKNRELFLKFIPSSNSKNTIFIGDRVKSELLLGNQLGATTIWVQRGKFADELPTNEEEQPTYVVTDLRKCISIIEQF